MSYHYEFADIRLEVRMPEEERYSDHGVLRAFCSEPISSPDHSLTICLVDALSSPDGSCVYQDVGKQIYQTEDSIIRYAGNQDRQHLRIQRQGHFSQVQCLRKAYPAGVTPKVVLNSLEAEHLIVRNRGVLLHASFIRMGGSAILFTAPSGTGKSTQADLWCKYRNAELINGDRAAVMVRDDGIYACGIPFAGSSGVAKAAKLPLRAIVYLAQAPENRIEALKGFSAFRNVWEGCSLHTWDREDLSLASDCVLKILDRVPVFHLRCRPDAGAVDALYSVLHDGGCI